MVVTSCNHCPIPSWIIVGNWRWFSSCTIHLYTILKMTNKFLMPGASGFIGSHFHDVVDNNAIVNLDLVKPKWDQKSVYEKGDIRSLESVDEILSRHKCNVIINLAAEHKDFGLAKEDYFRTNELGTQVLCDAATKHGINTFVFYSSVAVYGNNQEPSTVEMTPNPNLPYGESKLAGEEVLKKWAAKDSKRKVLVMRPALVYGERNVANMYRLIDQINKGRYFHIGKGENIKSIAYVKNIVQATLYLLDNLKPGVNIYNYSDNPQLSSRQIAETIATALKRKNPITLPYSLVTAMGLPFDLAIKVTGKDLPISTSRIKKFCTETYHKAIKVETRGFEPKYSNVEGLQNMVKWYLKKLDEN